MRHAGDGPDEHRDRHAAPQSDVIQERSEHRVHDHVGDRKGGNGPAVVAGGHSGVVPEWWATGRPGPAGRCTLAGCTTSSWWAPPTCAILERAIHHGPGQSSMSLDGLDRENGDAVRHRDSGTGRRVVGDAGSRGSAAAAGRSVAAAVALAVFPGSASGIGAGSRWSRAARRIAAADSLAAAHVGGKPLRVSSSYCASAIRLRGRLASSTSRKRRGAAGRWCSSWCGTRFRMRQDWRSPRSTILCIAITDLRAGAARACGCRVGAHDPAGRRAAVPLLGADVQRASHPLRSPLCDRGRRISGISGARSADRDAVDGFAAAKSARARTSRDSAFAR